MAYLYCNFSVVQEFKKSENFLNTSTELGSSPIIYVIERYPLLFKCWNKRLMYSASSDLFLI